MLIQYLTFWLSLLATNALLSPLSWKNPFKQNSDRNLEGSLNEFIRVQNRLLQLQLQKEQEQRMLMIEQRKLLRSRNRETRMVYALGRQIEDLAGDKKPVAMPSSKYEKLENWPRTPQFELKSMALPYEDPANWPSVPTFDPNDHPGSDNDSSSDGEESRGGVNFGDEVHPTAFMKNQLESYEKLSRMLLIRHHEVAQQHSLTKDLAGKIALQKEANRIMKEFVNCSIMRLDLGKKLAVSLKSQLDQVVDSMHRFYRGVREARLYPIKEAQARINFYRSLLWQSAILKSDLQGRLSRLATMNQILQQRVSQLAH